MTEAIQIQAVAYLARKHGLLRAGRSDDKPAASAEEEDLQLARKNNMDAIGGQWKTA